MFILRFLYDNYYVEVDDDGARQQGLAVG